MLLDQTTIGWARGVGCGGREMMWSWLPHHHYHAGTTMATTTMKPKHQCHSAITTPPKTGPRPLSQAQRRRRLPQRRQEVHVDAPPRAQVV